MNKTTIDIGRKAKPFAKGLFLSAVQQIAQTLGDPSTHNWDGKNIYELTQDDIAKIRDFVKSHYESDIHALLTYGNRPAPSSWAQFSALSLGSCQMLPESYYAEVKKLHGYYEVFGMEEIHKFKRRMGTRHEELHYDRGIQQVGLETAKEIGINYMYYITDLLKQFKTPPENDEDEVDEFSLVPYYSYIVNILKTKKETGYMIAALDENITNSNFEGIEVLYIIKAFFNQHKKKGATRLQEFLEVFHDKKNDGFIRLLKDFAAKKSTSHKYQAQRNNKTLVDNIVAIDDFQKLRNLYERSKDNRTLSQRKDLLLDDENYGEGVAYLNSLPLETLQQQLDSGNLKQCYIAFQTI